MTRKSHGPKNPQAKSEMLKKFAHNAPALERRSRGSDDILDERQLALGEKERLFELLSHDDEEVRCAAVYVMGKLGLMQEALPFLGAAFDASEENSDFRAMLTLALESVPSQGYQFMMLLDMRESSIDAERRFAQIVMEKADIKQQGLSSW